LSAADTVQGIAVTDATRAANTSFLKVFSNTSFASRISFLPVAGGKNTAGVASH